MGHRSLELGYAIALLGWDKIILFCNEQYGTDEALPFDIRQHRRIGYRFLKGDDTFEIKSKLAAYFRTRLIELLEKGKSNSNIKQPAISVLWNYLNNQEKRGSNVGVDSKTIILQHVRDISYVKEKVEQEIMTAKKVDGNIDPKWDEKLENYIGEANKFIDELDDEIKKQNYLMHSNADKIYPITLSVENEGNTTASNVRVEIPIPEWLFAFEKFPNRQDVPKKPNPPTPTPPRRSNVWNALENIANLGIWGAPHDSALVGMHIKHTYDCYLKGESINFWADRLLHKHTLTNRNDRFYFMARPNAPKGEATLKGKAFCSEYDDWQDFELVINII